MVKRELLMKLISQRLVHFRNLKGLTQKQVAERLAVPVTTYRNWEYGKAIRGEPYVALAQIFEISILELLTGSKPGKSEMLRALENLDKEVKNIREIALASE